MAVTDTISDVLTRVRNSQAAGHAQVVVQSSRQTTGILEALQREGYIRGFKVNQIRPGVQETVVELKYYEGKPVIQQLKRISKPGRRVYNPIGTLPKVANGLGTAVLSTSRGILSDVEAREQNVGGEVLFEVL